jgi:mono/diheme cytochrome c family protein
MRIRAKDVMLLLGSLLVFSMILAACGGSEPDATPTPAAEIDEDEGEHIDEHAEDEHDEGEHDEDEDAHSPDDHMAGAHDVPEEAAAVPNPLAGDEASTAAGGELYASSCAVCHGETGEGDGPGATGMEPPPANLHEDHVLGLTDGALFYIISHGKPDTPMPAWENILTEDQRWQVVNFMRTFGEN